MPNGQGLRVTPPPPSPRSLDALLAPDSVAVIGASQDPTRIGGRPIRYMREAGYAGNLSGQSRRSRVQGPGDPRLVSKS